MTPIWPGCPVQAVGTQGSAFVFQDVHGIRRQMTKLGRAAVLILFGGAVEELAQRFPVYQPDGSPERVRFNHYAAQLALIRACTLADAEASGRAMPSSA